MLNINIKNNNKELRLKHNLLKSKFFCLTGLTTFLRLFLVRKIAEISNKKKILLITVSEQIALKYQNDLKVAFDLDSEILPYQNVSMYESISPNLYDYSKQLKILNSTPNVIIAPVKALLEKFPTKKFIEDNSIKLKIGEYIDINEFAQELVNLGYKRSTMVSDISEFSIRGNIIDIFSLSEYPIRIELWGDEIVDLRFFNNETQKSIKKVKNVTISPIYKFSISNNAESIPPFLKEKIKNGYFEGIEVYQNYFNNQLVSIFDYLQDYIIVFDEMSEISSKYEFISNNYQNYMLENLKSGLNFELNGKNHFEINDFYNQIIDFSKVGLNNFIDYDFEDLIEFDARPIKGYFATLNEIIEYIRKKKVEDNFDIIVATDYSERVKKIFADENIFDLNFISNITCASCILEDLKIVLITDRELFNKRSKKITASKRSYYKEKQEFIDNINDIKENEYVVHNIHGVGVYKGLSQQQIYGQYKDYLTIEYANGDKLHMPAEQINMLCRYRGAGVIKPKLSRMGGRDWDNTKTKVKKEVEEVAQNLLKLYAKRKIAKGIPFETDSPWQIEMEEAFEYVETPDQMNAILDVKTDMESEMPMDRLICGDVGFGKTEVAIRAIFKAVSSGKQVAIIVPTTILAMQHFQIIEERFKPFGLNVKLLCRFRNINEQKQTLKELALGTCDVVIATHRLLQKDIIFKDIGLLVIDEEHRFGVRHKEQLKTLKENIDVMSMSATPIPRTLYMSLSGIKDISVINTPPRNRLPIKTFVGEFNETTLKNAIVHELDRDGQIFYLYNKIQDIEEFRFKLQKIIPNLKIAVGHSKLDEKKLEQIMIDFANKDFDILLCTTIIESGLDIPNVNTIIIHDADRFGLAQLYQLRGRVGRCERQAYCYCFYKKNKDLTKEAFQRLKAIKEFTTLGSGYQVALRDVEIRGIGNILGTKQHGHMVHVGFDTYCQLLDESINELQNEVVEKVQPAIVDLNITAFIPDEWVGSKEQKIIEYKRLSDVKSQIELDYITEEWKDRFSSTPKPVENLIKLIKIRLAATEAKISVIRETTDNIRLYTPYLPPEWKIIQSILPPNITKYIKFILAPKACTDGNSIILLNTDYINFNEIFNILSDLFYYIHKVKYEYTK